ncbi:hypothetical protein F0562_010924 [Nyssa sinensis]|uniref:Uncharacterized protein n=1 Tax=Nyssa sinensis TaxID=561372 RepID=A0A5J5A509_9ASTE|nr:hypothetical protein F0562_010924 [Nyssa sinensis]
MELPRATIQHMEQKQIQGNNIHGYSCFLNCSVIDDMHTSEVTEQPGHTASPDVNCKEKFENAGSFHLGVLNDSSMPFDLESCVNTEVKLLADSLSTERTTQKICQRRKIKKGKAEKKKWSSDKVVCKTRQSRCDQHDAMASYQPSNEKRDCAAYYHDESPKSDLPSVIITSPCAFAAGHTVHFCKDSGSTCCDGLNPSRTGPEELTSNCCAEDMQEESLQCNSCETIIPMSCEVKNCTSENFKISCHHCSSINNVDAVTPRDEFKSSTWTTQCEAGNKRSNNCSIWNGKENSHSEAQNRWRKRLNPFYVGMDVSLRKKIFLLKRNSFSS